MSYPNVELIRLYELEQYKLDIRKWFNIFVEVCPECGGKTDPVYDNYNTWCKDCGDTPTGTDVYAECQVCRKDVLVRRDLPGPCKCGKVKLP